MTSDSQKDIYIVICEEFSKSFKHELAESKSVSESLKHHADALENCLKLLQAASEHPYVQNLWNGIIRSTLNTLLNLNQRPSQACLKEFVSLVKPWLIDKQFKGLNHVDLLEMYRLAKEGPWTKPPLNDLIEGKINDAKKLAQSFQEDPDFIKARLRTLYINRKYDKLSLYGCAMLIHPKMKGNVDFENIFQRFVNMSLNKKEIKRIMVYFNLKTTLTVIDELVEENETVDKLCTAALEFLWEKQATDQLEELTSKWCQILHNKLGVEKFFKTILQVYLNGKEQIKSVQQCIILATAVWKEIPDKSRFICVEILHHALCILAPDEINHDQIETGIMSSIIYFVPNTQVARYCVLTIFISEPSVDHYFAVAKAFKKKFDRKKKLENYDVQMKLLDRLQRQWPPEFLLSNSWDWMRLRKLCHETMAREDAAYVQLVETEEAQKSLAAEISVEDNLVPVDANNQEVEGGHNDDSELDTSSKTDPNESCDCVICALKHPNGKPPHHEHSVGCHLRSTSAEKKVLVSLPESFDANKSAQWTCPEETCGRVFRSKTGISRHLNAIHSWSSLETKVFFDSLDNIALSQKTRTSRSDFLGKSTILNEDNILSVNQEAESRLSIEAVAEKTIGASEGSVHNAEVLTPNQHKENKDSSASVGGANFMKSDSSLPNVEPKGFILPSLFPSNSNQSKSSASAPDEVKSNVNKTKDALDIECPIESCTRTFRHRHTVQAHIEFRHKIAPKKATTLAQNAKYVPRPPGDLLRNKSKSTQENPSDVDILKSKGWYWLVDDFLYLEVEQSQPSVEVHYKRQDTVMKNSIARDVMFCFGNVPTSFDLSAAQNNIEKNWSFTLPSTENLLPQEKPEVDDFEAAEAINSMGMDTFQFDHHDPELDVEPPQVTRKLTDIKSLLKMEVQLKVQQKSEDIQISAASTTKQVDNFPEKHLPTEQLKKQRNVESQTDFKPEVGAFHRDDHFHVMKDTKLKSWKNKTLSLAFTVKTAGFCGVPTRTIASQCCTDVTDKIAIPYSNANLSSMKYKYANTPPVAKKGSLQQKKGLLSSKKSLSAEGNSSTAKPKTKRKYDIQTIYQMAEKYKDVEPDVSVTSEVSLKSSFEDALNYNTTTALLAERVRQKQRRKSSSKPETKVTDCPTTKALQPLSEKPVKQTETSQTKPKKLKKIKPILAKDVGIKRHGEQGSLTVSVKRQKQDTPDSVKMSSAKYEDLLKQAEELNTKKKVLDLKPTDTIASESSNQKTFSVGIIKTAQATVPASTDLQVVTTDFTTKSNVRKRRISLRKLSSMLKLDEEVDDKESVVSNESLKGDDSLLSENDSLYNSENLNRSTSSSETTFDSTDPNQSVIICPECKKQMKSAFALACHMRKRHKGHSKKIFLPNSSAGTSGNVVSSEARRSKNEFEPPEEDEACDSFKAVANQVARANIHASCPIAEDSNDNIFSTFGSNLSDLESDEEAEIPDPILPQTFMPIQDSLSEDEKSSEEAPVAIFHSSFVPRQSTPVPQIWDIGEQPSNATKEMLWVRNLRDKYCCLVTDCKCSYTNKPSLFSHMRRKHNLLQKTQSAGQTQYLSVEDQKKFMLLTKDHILKSGPNRSYADSASDSTPHRQSDKLIKRKSEKRMAHKQAAFQIQLDASSPNKRKWDMARELSILYNKRANRRIALSLKPAPKTEVVTRSPSNSEESVESFEADFQPQFCCWNCKEMFHTRTNFTKHIQSHLKLLSLIKYRCNFYGCLYAFNTERELESHKVFHRRKAQHLCLFCPNSSTAFRSCRKLINHEQLQHRDLKVNMETLRRQFCLRPVKTASQQIKKHSTASDRSQGDTDDSDSSIEDHFLANGHRRPTGNTNGMCDKCKHKMGPSVALPQCCSRSYDSEVLEVVFDLVYAVHKYHLKSDKPTLKTPKRTKKSKTPIKLQNPKPVSIDAKSCDLPTSSHLHLDNDFFSEQSATTGIRTSHDSSLTDTLTSNTTAGSVNQSKQRCDIQLDFQKPVEVSTDECMEFDQNKTKNANVMYPRHNSNQQNNKVVGNECSHDPQSFSHNISSPIETSNLHNVDTSPEPTTDNITIMQTVDQKESPLLFNDSGVSKCDEPTATSTEHEDIKEFLIEMEVNEDIKLSFDVVPEVSEVIHNLLCDVEIEEQAMFLRLCGMVPTDVLYLTNNVETVASGVSVYGYKAEAFMWLEFAEKLVRGHAQNQPEASSGAIITDLEDNDTGEGNTSNALGLEKDDKSGDACYQESGNHEDLMQSKSLVKALDEDKVVNKDMVETTPSKEEGDETEERSPTILAFPESELDSGPLISSGNTLLKSGLINTDSEMYYPVLPLQPSNDDQVLPKTPLTEVALSVDYKPAGISIDSEVAKSDVNETANQLNGKTQDDSTLEHFGGGVLTEKTSDGNGQENVSSLHTGEEPAIENDSSEDKPSMQGITSNLSDFKDKSEDRKNKTADGIIKPDLQETPQFHTHDTTEETGNQSQPEMDAHRAREVSLLHSHMISMSVARNHPLWTLDANLTHSDLVPFNLSQVPPLQQMLFCRYNVVVNPDLGYGQTIMCGALTSYPPVNDHARSVAYNMLQSARTSDANIFEPKVEQETNEDKDCMPTNRQNRNETKTSPNLSKMACEEINDSTLSSDTGASSDETSFSSSTLSGQETSQILSVLSTNGEKAENSVQLEDKLNQQYDDVETDTEHGNNISEDKHKVAESEVGKKQESNKETISSLSTLYTEDCKELKTNQPKRRSIFQNLPSMFHKKGRPKTNLFNDSNSSGKKYKSMAEIVAFCDNISALQEQLNKKVRRRDRNRKKSKQPIEKPSTVTSDMENNTVESSMEHQGNPLEPSMPIGRKKPRKPALTKRHRKKQDVLVYKTKLSSDLKLIPVVKRLGTSPDANINKNKIKRRLAIEKRARKNKTAKDKPLKLVPVINRLEMSGSETLTSEAISKGSLTDHTYLKQENRLKKKPTKKRAKHLVFPCTSVMLKPTMTLLNVQSGSAKPSTSSSTETAPDTAATSSTVLTTSTHIKSSSFPHTCVPSSSTTSPTATATSFGRHPIYGVISSVSLVSSNSKEEFPCSMCNEIIAGTKQYVTHLSVKHIFCKKKFQCKKSHCFRSFDTSDELTDHTILHDSGGYPCLFCREWSQSLKDINIHIYVKHANLQSSWNSTLSDIARRCTKRKMELSGTTSTTPIKPNITQKTKASTQSSYQLSYEQFLKQRNIQHTGSTSPLSKATQQVQLQIRSLKEAPASTTTKSTLPSDTKSPAFSATTAAGVQSNPNIAKMEKIFFKQLPPTFIPVRTKSPQMVQSHSDEQVISNKVGQNKPSTGKSMLVMKPQRVSCMENFNSAAASPHILPRPCVTTKAVKLPVNSVQGIQVSTNSTQPRVGVFLQKKLKETPQHEVYHSNILAKQPPKVRSLAVVQPMKRVPPNNQQGVIIKKLIPLTHSTSGTSSVNITHQPTSTESELSYQNGFQAPSVSSSLFVQNHSSSVFQQNASPDDIPHVANSHFSARVQSNTINNQMVQTPATPTQMNSSQFTVPHTSHYNLINQNPSTHMYSSPNQVSYQLSTSKSSTSPNQRANLQVFAPSKDLFQQSSTHQQQYLASNSNFNQSSKINFVPVSTVCTETNQQAFKTVCVPFNHQHAVEQLHRKPQINYQLQALIDQRARQAYAQKSQDRVTSHPMPYQTQHSNQPVAEAVMFSNKRQMSSVYPVQAKRRKISSHLPSTSKNESSSKNERQLFLNLELEENQINILECEYCNNMYSKLTDLREHMQRDHYLHLCPKPGCGSVCGSQKSLQNHCDTMHIDMSWITRNMVVKSQSPITCSSGLTATTSQSSGPQSINTEIEKANENRKIAESVWNTVFKRDDKERNREKFQYYLNHNNEGVSESEIMRCLFIEVKTYTERTAVLKSEQGLECKRCPIMRCDVLGGKMALYYHILEQHGVMKIFRWVQKRMNDAKRRKQIPVSNPVPIVIDDDEEEASSHNSSYAPPHSAQKSGTKEIQYQQEQSPVTNRVCPNHLTTIPVGSVEEITIEVPMSVDLQQAESSTEEARWDSDDKSPTVHAFNETISQDISIQMEEDDCQTLKAKTSYYCLVKGCYTHISGDVETHMKLHPAVKTFHIEGTNLWPIYDCVVNLAPRRAPTYVEPSNIPVTSSPNIAKAQAITSSLCVVLEKCKPDDIIAP